MYLEDKYDLGLEVGMECPRCNGLGYIDHYYNEYDIWSDECLLCDGKGIIE